MKATSITLAGAAIFAAAAPANATDYRFAASGTIASAYSADRDFKQVPNPPSSINIGDRFSVSFMLSPIGVQPTELYDADPRLNIYYTAVTDLKIMIGSFETVPTSGGSDFATVQLWDNYLSGGRETDAFSISLLRFLPNGASPVDLGTGQISAHFNFNAFDWTATARSSDLFTELPSLSRYNSLGASLGFLNGSSYLQTGYSVYLETATLSAAVPEPTTWAMMIIGVGFIGGAARRRKVTFAQA